MKEKATVELKEKPEQMKSLVIGLSEEGFYLLLIAMKIMFQHPHALYLRKD